MFFRKLLLFFTILVLLETTSSFALNVYVRSKPLYSLVSMVSNNVFKPHLIPSNLSTDYINKIQASDLVFVINKNLEKNILPITNQPNVIQIIDFKNLNIVSYNNDHIIQENGVNIKKNLDGALLLDPMNAKIILKNVEAYLSIKDPKNLNKYKDNLIKFSKLLNNINNLLYRELSIYKNSKFISYNDNFNYFYRSFGLNNLASITNNNNLSDSYTLSEKNIIDTMSYIKNNNISCVFLDKTNENKNLIKNLNENKIKNISLDYLGLNYTADWHLYSRMMANNLGAVKICLGK